MIKATIQNAFSLFGYQIKKYQPEITLEERMPVEFDSEDIEAIRYVVENQLSMASIERLVATVQACKFSVLHDVEGDFVECGVWRGGSSLLAKLIFERLGSDKKVYLFDTFAGMTEPTEMDRKATSSVPAFVKYKQLQKQGYNDWCYASLEDVKNNFVTANVNLDEVKFIKGDVLKSLSTPENLPATISTLRLDTDWYESTLKELNVLYPRLSVRGALLIDDYGSWDGARKAVEEYFSGSQSSIKPLMYCTDASGRMAVKVTA